jgi:hypothetical protein
LGSSFAYGTRRLLNPNVPPSSYAVQRLRNNDYAKYTRKFSLGNGPTDWIAEYMITKESGKMLGTLVALALQKMVNLETFIWDMPTGVSSDIFMALSSLPEQSLDGDCKLERVWVRWHDNTELPVTSAASSPALPTQPLPAPVPIPPGSTLTPIGVLISPTPSSQATAKSRIAYSDSCVEYPTFSVLPPLRSLTVLDIDEPEYLDEMAVVIERSKSRLQELRVGISTKAVGKDFVQTWDGAHLHQVDHNARWPGESSIGDRRLGGILGILVGRVYDIRRKIGTRSKDKTTTTTSPPEPSTSNAAGSSPSADIGAGQNDQVDEPLSAQGSGSTALPAQGSSTAAALAPNPSATEYSLPYVKRDLALPVDDGTGRKRLDGKLRLQTLELERVPLSMQVCSKAIDWTILNTLTILDCNHHENLWKILRKQYQPTSLSSGFGTSSKHGTTLQYQLNLKKIHTDITSITLINFIKETLAPNSLEILFLQDRRRVGVPTVTIDQIYRGAIKRHRSSLKKLLLDSSDKNARVGTGPDGMRWRHWVLTSEVLLYMTSGRMNNLKELAGSIDYNDWVSYFGLLFFPFLYLSLFFSSLLSPSAILPIVSASC